MDIKRITFSEPVISRGRISMPRMMAEKQEEYRQQFDSCGFIMKYSFTTDMARPFGPVGNYAQVLSVTVEGDYDNPSFKEYYDRVVAANTKAGKAGCYVATAVYGSYDCPQVWALRRYRDYTLAATWYGRAFIHTYYAISPTLVKWFGNTEWFKKMWKGKLDRMVENLKTQGVMDTPYEDKPW